MVCYRGIDHAHSETSRLDVRRSHAHSRTHTHAHTQGVSKDHATKQSSLSDSLTNLKRLYDELAAVCVQLCAMPSFFTHVHTCMQLPHLTLSDVESAIQSALSKAKPELIKEMRTTAMKELAGSLALHVCFCVCASMSVRADVVCGVSGVVCRVQTS